jgi:hypothetical protein
MNKILLIILASLFLCSSGCVFGRERLPEEIPADLNIVLTENGGVNGDEEIMDIQYSADGEKFAFIRGNRQHDAFLIKRLK